VVEDIASENNVADRHSDRGAPGTSIRPIGRVGNPVPVRLAQ
jgi:hypothetical protein